MEQAENIKQRALRGLNSYGLTVRMLDPYILEMAKRAGFQFARIDCEHVYYDYATLRVFFDKARLLGLAAQIRLTDTHNIEALLALEPAAVCFPGVESGEQAQGYADAVKFAPLGRRGMYGGTRGVRYGGVSRKEYEATGNDRTHLIVQIESITAVEHIDEILSVRGIDMVASGKADLAQSMGLSGQKDHPDVIAAEDLIIRKALEYGKVPTLSVRSPERLAELQNKGVRCFSVGCDEDLCFQAIKNCYAGLALK